MLVGKNLIKLTALCLILVIFLVIMSIYQKTNPATLPEEQSVNNTYKATSYKPAELQALLAKDKDKYAVIDVRSKQEYEKGHLPGAIHADYYDTDSLVKAAGNKIPVTYCAFSAMRGPYAAYQLNQAGFKNAAVLDGGISAWAEEIDILDSINPFIKTVFNHPKNIFPVREKGKYPPNQGEVKFDIVATQFAFNPNQIRVKHGQTVKIHLVSHDVAHGFSLPEFGIEIELLPNEPVDVTFIADRKGNFPFVCSVICGHSHSSMVGNLIVE